MMLKPREFCNSYCKFLRGFRWFGHTENFLCSTSYGRWYSRQCAAILLLQYTR